MHPPGCHTGLEAVFTISIFSTFLGGVLFSSSSVLSIHFHSKKSSRFHRRPKRHTHHWKKSRHKERAALRLAHAVRAEEKEAKQTTCRFFVARSRRARDTPRCEYKRRRRRRHTLEQQQRHRKQQPEDFLLLLRRRRRRRLRQERTERRGWQKM